MSRLVVISNRVADLRSASQSGGLAVAVADALKRSGGLWFGGQANPDDAPDSKPTIDTVDNVRLIQWPLTSLDHEQYYLGYANSVLWPLFHYRTDLVSFRSEFFEGYVRVNDKLAAGLVPHLVPDDIVWAHDYHLIPFAHSLRAHGVTARMGFFLHIPFPPLDLLAAAPNHLFILECLLDYDVVGFQTRSDLLNFQRAVQESGLGEVSDSGDITRDGRTIHVARFPIGIDVDAFRTLALRSAEDVNLDQMRRRILGRKQVIGVDRLDYSKGLPERFEAFGRLLAGDETMERAVSFIQIAPPTRETIPAYVEIKESLELLSGRINGRFADIDWTPIKYIHRPVPRDKLASLFRSSEVGLVTPLRDGMNLVAKEYVAAQDPDDPGVLILSQFAGAAEEMDAALMVNPYHVEEMAEVLAQALKMPLEERRERHAALIAAIRRYDVHAWREDFLTQLRGASAASGRPAANAA